MGESELDQANHIEYAHVSKPGVFVCPAAGRSLLYLCITNSASSSYNFYYSNFLNPHEGLDISCSTDAVSCTSGYWVHLCYYELSERNRMAWALQEIHNIKQEFLKLCSSKQNKISHRRLEASPDFPTTQVPLPQSCFESNPAHFFEERPGVPTLRRGCRVEDMSPCSAAYVHLILLQHHGFY